MSGNVRSFADFLDVLGVVRPKDASSTPPSAAPSCPGHSVNISEARRLDLLTLSIAAVERDTGLSKDTLRVWERRYGFPQPARDAQGERAYPLDQIDKLRLVKRLLDAGHRPGRIVGLPLATLQALSESTVDQIARAGGAAARNLPDRAGIIELIRRHDPEALAAELLRLSMRHGLASFLVDVLAPLSTAVSDAWIRGQIETFEEQVYSETVQVVLRRLIASLPTPAPESRPRVLLCTFAGEPHGLGLLTAQALFVLEGCRCLSLGAQTPIWDIAQAARAQPADIVALSFSGSQNPNQIVDGLAELRAKLPASVEVWAGGNAPVLRRRQVEGVRSLTGLDELAPQLRRWRAATELVAGY
ncbi:MAG: MerR family transcriptional regulator [Burkholderiales bacterium]|nr:MerR family transcriptional regulator [Burkholderiales bacterium]MDE2396555.1 MerR family transcriptional regulator [Burkholderiales bacterium]MDE2453689.1 MerR family transcriptional regulator [Burkholderiales bacterium]